MKHEIKNINFICFGIGNIYDVIEIVSYSLWKQMLKDVYVRSVTMKKKYDNRCKEFIESQDGMEATDFVVLWKKEESR